MQSTVQGEMNSLDGVYKGSYMISYPALINQLSAKIKKLNADEGAAKKTADAADKEAKKQETAETDLMLQRAGVEYRCLEPGTCGNLHYHQTCGGPGSFSKKVSSWTECQDHCESLIKDGKKIAGCEIMYIVSDDRKGSGTCSAQTTCSLKASKSKSAGSLCKVTA